MGGYKSVIVLLVGLSGILGSRFFDPVRFTDEFSNDYLFDEVTTLEDPPVYSWTEAWTDLKIPVDHFSFTNADRFELRYFYHPGTWKPGNPVFFYTGNEGALESFANNTGMMWELAKQFNAYVVLAEHRYYGKTYPYTDGNTSYSDISKLGYLSSAQAIADYAMFLPWFKNKHNISADAPVVAFGGSYGGMLSIWFRLKYPTLTVGAWASSAPVTYFHNGGVDVGAFDNVAKNTFTTSGCDANLLKTTFDTITKLGQSSEGKQKLTDIFIVDPASPLQTDDDVRSLKMYFQMGMEYMAMTDYPYPTNFLNPMPGWPVKTGCDIFSAIVGNKTTDETALLQGLLGLTNIYYNYTGQTNTTCLDPSKCGTNPNGNTLSDAYDGWDFQECTEIIIEMCSLGWPNDFFDPTCNNKTFLDFQVNQICTGLYGSIGWKKEFLREDAVRQLYGWDFSRATNILFTNGALDPWSRGGVNEKTPGIGGPHGDPSRGIYNYVVGGSAHHLDLRQPYSCDPDSVKNVRYQAVQIIQCWINPNGAGCPFQPSDLPAFTTMDINAKCTYKTESYPWGQSSNPSTGSTAGPTGSTTTSGGVSVTFAPMVLLIASFLLLL